MSQVPLPAIYCGLAAAAFGTGAAVAALAGGPPVIGGTFAVVSFVFFTVLLSAAKR